MTKTYLAIAFLITGFLVVGGVFEKATARELRSGMDLLEICTKNLPFEEGKKIDYYSLGHCLGFIEGVSGTLSDQIDREELYQLSGTPLTPRKFCIPEDITVGRFNGTLTGWLQKNYKKNGDKALRFGASRNVARALLDLFPCKDLDKSFDTLTEPDKWGLDKYK